MLNRLNQILVTILILTLIGAVAIWFVSRQPNTEYIQMPTFDTPDTKTPVLDDVISNTPIDVDLDDPTALFQYLLTDEEQAQPVVQQFLKIVESPAYAAFIESEPETLGDFYDFYASQGLPVDKNEMLNVFLELAPAGTPEQLENRARVELSVQFQQIPYNIRSSKGIQAFQKVVEDYLADEQNTAWMMTHFDGNFNAFGDWAVDVFRNPVDDIPESFDFVEIERATIPTQRPELSTPIAETEKKTIENEQPRANTQPAEIDDPKPLTETESIASPEHDIETLFGEQMEDYTKEQLHRGIQYLLIFGEEEGFKRLQVTDPEMAKQLQQVIRQRKKGDIPR